MRTYDIVFADLDGTLINTISRNTFPKGVWDMEINFKVLDRIKELKPKYVFIISNQNGIEKGFVNRVNFVNKIGYICSAISEYCNVVCDYDYCPVADDPYYRKPGTGMLSGLLLKHGIIEYKASDMIMIGDASGKPDSFSDSDKKCANNFSINYVDVYDLIRGSDKCIYCKSYNDCKCKTNNTYNTCKKIIQ